MIVSRIFLAAIGVIYVYLAVWCSLMPARASRLVGFELQPGSGESEFLVIYGGLEMALAIIFLLPFILPHKLEHSLLVCLIVHACLVAFRTVSFFLYTDISSMTQTLAFYEWLIFLGAAALVGWESRIRRRRSPVGEAAVRQTDNLRSTER